MMHDDEGTKVVLYLKGAISKPSSYKRIVCTSACHIPLGLWEFELVGRNVDVAESACFRHELGGLQKKAA